MGQNGILFLPKSENPIHIRSQALTMYRIAQEEALERGQCPVEGPLLDGHLSLTVELLTFRSVSERYHFGSHPHGQQLLKVGGEGGREGGVWFEGTTIQ